MIGLLTVAILVGNPIKIQTQTEVIQPTINYTNVQIVGSEVNEINEPPKEIPIEGYITINDVVDAWDITPNYDNVDVIEYDCKIDEVESVVSDSLGGL